MSRLLHLQVSFAKAPAEAAESSPSAVAPATHVGDPGKLLVPGLGWAQPWLLRSSQYCTGG